MIARRLFSLTLAVGTAAAGAQVALADSNVPDVDVQAAVMSTSLVQPAMWVQRPRAQDSRHRDVIRAAPPDRVAGSTLRPSIPALASVI